MVDRKGRLILEGDTAVLWGHPRTPKTLIRRVGICSETNPGYDSCDLTIIGACPGTEEYFARCEELEVIEPTDKRAETIHYLF